MMKKNCSLSTKDVNVKKFQPNNKCRRQGLFVETTVCHTSLHVQFRLIISSRPSRNVRKTLYMFYSNQNNQYYLISKIFFNRKENKLTVSREKINIISAYSQRIHHHCYSLVSVLLFNVVLNYRISAFCSNDMECSLV